MMLVSQGGGWNLDAEKCPADHDFVLFLKAREIEGVSIFHMGSGNHHIVGMTCATNGKNNSVMAVTNCREEMSSYIDWAIANPRESQFYKLWFADLHQLDTRQLPRFDIVNLPHLGEMGAPAPYSHLSIEDVVWMFQEKLWDGCFVFYRRSAAWDKISGLIDSMLSSGWESEDFASLIILRRT